MKNLIFLLIFCVTSYSQNKTVSKNKSFQIDLGFSKNGSGDLNGNSINFEYHNYFKPKWNYSIGLGSTIHNGQYDLYYKQGDREIDGSYRYVTAGYQLTSKLGFCFINSKKSDFGLRLGALLRYQSSSYPDEISTNYPPFYGFDFPLIDVKHYEPQKIFSAGGILQLYYNYNINEKLFVGSSGTFQTDSNEDAILQLSLTCGMRFN
jgi:hypothetical protein